MNCTNCGTVILKNEYFCPVCGQITGNVSSSFDPTQHPTSNKSAYAHYYNPSPVPPRTPVSVGGWIGRSLISLIPIVGGLIYFIMLFVWAYDSSKEESFCNWAKAQLFIMLIGFIIAVVVILFIAIMGISA